jgi:hypothetical protein
MPPEKFETAIPTSEQQIHALERVVTGIGREAYYFLKYATLLLEG